MLLPLIKHPMKTTLFFGQVFSMLLPPLLKVSLLISPLLEIGSFLPVSDHFSAEGVPISLLGFPSSPQLSIVL